MGMLLQRNRERQTSEVEEVVSDIQPKEVTTSEVEEVVSDIQPKRKPRAKKA